MQEEKSKFKSKIINIFIIFVMLLIGIYLYARYVEPSKLLVKEYRIESNSLPSSFSGIKIVHISDIYYGNTTDLDYMKELVKRVNLLKPDLILFTGNLYGNNVKHEKELMGVLNELNSKLGKYAVKGNNDYYEGYESFMESISFTVLKNSYDTIYNEDISHIFICGLSSSLKEEVSFEECGEYINSNEEELYQIYMVHESDVSKKILDNTNANLILSGNSLGGIINIPFYGSLFTINGSKNYKSDYIKSGDTDIFVSSGIGTDKYPYRFMNKPSFNLYRLKSL